MGYLHMTEDIARLEELLIGVLTKLKKKSKNSAEEQDFVKGYKIVTIS